ncbi:MAG: hypothetical protein WCK84_05105 [Bacteroidota bacterium]
MLLFWGCKPANQRLNVDVSKIIIADVRIHRYDIDLFNLKADRLQQGLEALKPEYRFFLDADLGDPEKLAGMIAYLENPRNLAFQQAVAGQYKDLNILERDLTNAFRHYLFYYPGKKIPRVYSYISGGDYDFPVQFADSVLLIGLDNYLGKDFKPYFSDGLPVYRVSRMNKDKIIPDCMKLLVDVTHPVQLPGNNLLEQMIESGKRLYFIDSMIPQTEDRLKIGYSKVQNDWIVSHEANVWAAIIENRLLYTTDGKLIRSFMADGPFTAEFSNEAPSRLGEWLGWQIVRKYMDNQPDVTLQELMTEKDAQKILSLSGYKPEK